MHNLFLGIAKHTVDTWRQLQILKSVQFDMLQERVDSIIPPAGIGRIPRKISSSFSSFTADKWKHWTLLYSVHALYKIIPDEHYQYWCFFVDACRILCKLKISSSDIAQAHTCILNYCKKFEEVCGKEYCTPNMHMACHLKSNLIDYGPIASFWTFSFERYNGILESMKMSWRNPEKQMLLKFLDMQAVARENLDSNSGDKRFCSYLMEHNVLSSISTENFDSCSQSLSDPSRILQQFVYTTCPIQSIDATLKNWYTLSLPKRRKCFKHDELQNIKMMYDRLYPGQDGKKMSYFYEESRDITINGEHFVSEHSRSQRSAAIVAHWPNQTGSDIDVNGTAPMRTGIVSSIFTHEVKLDESSETMVHCIASVKWHMQHPRRDHFHISVIVSCNLLESPSPATFIPVSRIAGRCAIRRNYKFTFDYG